MNTSSNTTSPSFSYSLYLSSGESIAVAFVSAVLAAVGTLGNLAVVASFLSSSIARRYSEYSTNLFLCSLAVADFMVSALLAPLFIRNLWLYSKSSHSRAFADFACVASLLSILALTVNRFIKIFWPLRYRHLVTSTRAKVVGVSIWAVSSTSFALNLVGEEKNILELTKNERCLILVVTIIGIFCYGAICRTTLHHRNEIRQRARVTTGEDNVRTSFSTLVLVFGTFILGYLPATLVNIIVKKDLHPRSYFRASAFTIPFIFANSAIDPFLYYLKSENFRNVLRRINRVYIAPRLEFQSSSQSVAWYIRLKRRNMVAGYSANEVELGSQSNVLEMKPQLNIKGASSRVQSEVIIDEGVLNITQDKSENRESAEMEDKPNVKFPLS